ncbi:MAG: ABC transporter ATP-binding protein/permease [SAR324 cluster bacterium]|nr:ABC transporter ATP-binding protein/permease [SAR324 cluster bacterium]
MNQKTTLHMDRILNGEELPPGAVSAPADITEEEMFSTVFNETVIKRFIRFMAPYKLIVAASFLSVVIFTITQLSIPILVQMTLDQEITFMGTGLESLKAGMMLFAATILINFISHFCMEFLVSRVAQRLLFDMRRAMYEHLQRISLTFMDKTEVGRLMSRLQGDVGALQEFLETSVHAFGDLILLIGIIFVLLWMDLRLGAMTLALLPILMVIRYFWLPIARKAFVKARITSSIVTGTMCENIRGVKVVQGMIREPVNYTLYEEKANDHFKSTVRAAKIAQIMLPTVDTLTGLAMAIIVVVGGGFVLEGELTAGVMIAYILFVQRFFDPIRALTMHYNVFQRAMASGERIFEVLDVSVDIQDVPGAVDMEQVRGSIEFKNVTFAYHPGQPVLNQINLEIKEGETVALVGPTGCGKSSMASLVHHFYDTYSGTISIAGHDLRKAKQSSLGKQIAMVLQEPYLFSEPIFTNIRYSNTQATFKEVEQAAKTVGAHEFISKLPQGYDTILEERGSNLSLGQRQLLAFARALVADAPILILDEATASIDSESELMLQQALDQLLKNRTAIIIAHRLATVRKADQIVVMQEGRIVEKGTHEELLESGGLFASLHSLNFASFDDVPEEMVRKYLN